MPVLQVPAGEEGWPGAWRQKKEDDDEEEEMEGKKRDIEDMQDSLVVEEGMIVKFPLVPFATCLLPLQLLLQGSLQQEEVKQPRQKNIKKKNQHHELCGAS